MKSSDSHDESQSQRGLSPIKGFCLAANLIRCLLDYRAQESEKSVSFVQRKNRGAVPQISSTTTMPEQFRAFFVEEHNIDIWKVRRDCCHIIQEARGWLLVPTTPELRGKSSK